jgi:hypothetical protein
MQTMALVALTCWVCTLIASPHRPRAGNDVAELVYARLLGRQHRLALLAFGVTSALFLTLALGMPHRLSASEASMPRAAATETVCNDAMRCFSLYDQR